MNIDSITQAQKTFYKYNVMVVDLLDLPEQTGGYVKKWNSWTMDGC